MNKVHSELRHSILAWIVLLALVGILSLTIIQNVYGGPAGGDEKYVSLVSNTPNCFNCSTVYEVCGRDTTILLDPASMTTKFRYDKSDTLKDGSAVSYLKTFAVETNQTVLVNQSCKDSGNKTNDCSFLKDSYVSLTETTKVAPGECAKVRVTGQLEPGKQIDNVLVLNIDGVENQYTQWVFWNASDYAFLYHLNNDYTDASGNGNTLTAAGSGNAFTTSAKLGSHAHTCDGNGNIRILAGIAGLNTGNANRTFFAFIKPAAIPTNGNHLKIVGVGVAAGETSDAQFALRYSNVSNVGRLVFDGGGETVQSNSLSGIINVSTYAAIAATYYADNHTVCFWANNATYGCSALSDNQVFSQDSIALCDWMWGDGSQRWNGQIDEAMMLNLALNDRELNTKWNTSSGTEQTNLTPVSAPPNVAPTIALTAPSNGTKQYGNGSVSFNATVLDADNATLFNATFWLNSTLLFTRSSFANNTNTNYTLTVGADCVACQWYYVASDGNSATTSGISSIDIDVAPYNRGLTLTNTTSKDNQTFPLRAQPNLTLTNIFDHTASCNASVDGAAWQNMTNIGTLFEINTTAVFGNHSLNVTCSNTNTSIITVNQTFQVVDATPPQITVVQWTNNTQKNLNQTFFNVTIVDNSSLSTLTLNLNSTNYTMGLTNGTANVSGLAANGVYYVNITANDTLNNKNTSPTLLFITDSTAPILVAKDVQNATSTGSTVTARYNVSDNFETYGSIASIIIEVQQPAGSRINYTGSAESVEGFNYKATFLGATAGTYTVTNVFITDNAGNTRSNTTSDNVEVTTPPVGGVGPGGAGPSSPPIYNVFQSSADDEFRILASSPLGVNRVRFTRPLNALYTTEIETNRELASCSSSESTHFRCNIIDKNIMQVKFGPTDDKSLQYFFTTTLTATDQSGVTRSLPFTASILNFGAYIAVEPRDLGAMAIPLFFKTNGTVVTGVRYMSLGGAILLLAGLIFGLVKWFKR